MEHESSYLRFTRDHPLTPRVRGLFYVADGVAGMLQLASGVTIIALTATIANVSIGTFFPYQEFIEIPDGISVQWKLSEGPSIFPGYLFGAMCLITAFQHALSVVLLDFQWKFIVRGFNWLIWLEYMITASMMTLGIGWVLGLLTYGNSLVSAAVTATTILIGALIEWDIYVNGSPKPRTLECLRRMWAPFALSTFLTLIQWGNLFTYFGLSWHMSGTPPLFVVGGFLGTFFTFLTFPTNFALQRIGQGFNIGIVQKYPWIFRLVYIILSVVAKQTLVWFYMGGLLARVA